MSQAPLKPGERAHPDVKPGQTIGCACKRCLEADARTKAMSDDELVVAVIDALDRGEL